MNKQQFSNLKRSLKRGDKVTVQLTTFKNPINATVYLFSNFEDELLFQECFYAKREDIISCNKTNTETEQ